jgi:putative ABC transport system permease protein
MLQRYMHDIIIAVEAIMSNKLKSMLTALGIIFGVAAVISMLAIGNGAQQEILEQIKMVGVNNIVIVPTVNESTEESEEGESQSKKFSPGLTLADAKAIRMVIPGVENISPEVSYASSLQYGGVRYPAKIQGVAVDYFKLYNLPLESGMYFSEEQDKYGMPVCVIGSNVRTKFFNETNPLGKFIKFGNIWLKVIGVLKKTEITVSSFDNAGVNVYNDNIFVPVTTVLLRYNNRATVNKPSSSMGGVFAFSGGIVMISSSSKSSSSSSASINYNQLDRIIVQMSETEKLNPTTEILSRMILRRHQGVKDYEITVPEMLLKQQQRTKDIFNIVLGAIAGISLLVGGIGIMNIMFASVMERIKEIGTRLAIGAKKADIIAQFLSEAILISVSGGLIGVILGIALSYLITAVFEIKTIVSVLSVVLAFGISAAVGVIFGYAPAKKASERDPIESLRYE